MERWRGAWASSNNPYLIRRKVTAGSRDIRGTIRPRYRPQEVPVFQTIGRTWYLAKLSWSVLMKDKELVLFPVFSFLAIATVVGIFLAIALSTGSFDRLDAAINKDNTATTAAPGSPTTEVPAEEKVNVGDVTLYVVGFMLVTFCV